MIILQGNGGSGIGRWQLGSVAEKVVRLREIPVLFLRTL